LERQEALAASIAAAEADKPATDKSRKKTDIQQYLTTQDDKSHHQAPKTQIKTLLTARRVRKAMQI
jgi:hypothetical protein